jgi:transketolase
MKSKYMDEANLKQKERQIKRDILNASFSAGACHVGSALSCVSIMVKLFYDVLKAEDIFLFSKASGVATFYSILADHGKFPVEKISEYLHLYPLPSKEVPGVIHSCGSLGHGLPVACGLAYANRNKNVYVLISDAEVQEGTTYESALFARQHNLQNLHVIVDYNNIQACGHTYDILDLTTAFIFLKTTFPHIHTVATIKGEGVDFMENDPSWHYKNLTPELLEKALCQI